MTTMSIEITKEFIKRELLVFQPYYVNVKEIKCPLQWWEKYETMFPIVRFFACQILEFVHFQIEIKRIFSLTKILTNLRRCHLQ
jgi:hypothetical protein